MAVQLSSKATRNDVAKFHSDLINAYTLVSGIAFNPLYKRSDRTRLSKLAGRIRNEAFALEAAFMKVTHQNAPFANASIPDLWVGWLRTDWRNDVDQTYANEQREIAGKAIDAENKRKHDVYISELRARCGIA